MKKLLLLTTLSFAFTFTFSQSFIYQQQHREIVYDYGIIAENDYETITDIEKIKYDLRYSEKRVKTTITQNHSLETEIIIDSNGYKKPWMKLASKIVYNKTGITGYYDDGQVESYTEYKPEELEQNSLIQYNIIDNGYHPGITDFPSFSKEDIKALQQEGVDVIEIGEGLYKINGENQEITYDPNTLSVINEWRDTEGNLIKETTGYQPLDEYGGYVLTFRKTERFVKSYNGPCITEVNLVYYTDYNISDPGSLIKKATFNYESITVYPNPNTGVFNVDLTLTSGDAITNVKVVNLVDQSETIVPHNNTLTFGVDVSDKAAGNYVLIVNTNKTTLTKHFIKN